MSSIDDILASIPKRITHIADGEYSAYVSQDYAETLAALCRKLYEQREVRTYMFAATGVDEGRRISANYDAELAKLARGNV